MYETDESWGLAHPTRLYITFIFYPLNITLCITSRLIVNIASTTVFNQAILYLFLPLDQYLIQNVRVIVHVNLRVCLALYQLQFNYGISKIYLRVLSFPKNNCQKISEKKLIA